MLVMAKLLAKSWEHLWQRPWRGEQREAECEAPRLVMEHALHFLRQLKILTRCCGRWAQVTVTQEARVNAKQMLTASSEQMQSELCAQLLGLECGQR